MHETKGRHKLEPRYEGPFLVLERTGENSLPALRYQKWWRIHNDGRRCSKGQSQGRYPVGDDTGGAVTKIPTNPPQKDNDEVD
ncbi:hypothetical protein LAZ67_22001220 [Cordylochernes scorpioides]|uniref:Uncharacterized protein n=1 Tax=Cordylochernes scorpioides TaxID=51811 RepID=A0ABY6LR82_9ARAC|nr:hypothetical protein LAZ67_22001220 [Cordylochernes scorpioides]